MYGDSATELIRHISREQGDIIPEYQYQLVDKVIKESDELYAESLRTSQTGVRSSSQGGDQINDEANGGEPDEASDEENSAPENVTDNEVMVIQARHTIELWNKRCLIAYHYERLKRLKRLRWEYGNNLPNEVVKNLSKEELEWFAKYNENLFSYMSSLNDGNGLDLTLYLRPPKKLYIQVKCLRDYGQFDLEDGQPVMLKKDSIHYLPLSQCEKLIHQGVLEQTSL